jgi:hypothetical protein
VVAPQFDESAVLDAQHEHCPFTVEGLTPDLATDFNECNREPVIDQSILKIKSGGHIAAAIDGRLKGCATPLRQVLPGRSDDEIRALGRSMRRTFFPRSSTAR